LKDLDLAGSRLLLELAERAGEGDDLGLLAALPARGNLVEAPRVADVAAQDLLALSSVHAGAIGARIDPL
jgi:hypothetical protein